MVSSFGVSLVLLVLKREGYITLSPHYALLITIAVTTVCWLLTACFGPVTDRQTLISFYRKVRPFGPGWNRVRQQMQETPELETALGQTPTRGASGENIPLALLGWSAGCTVIWSSLFTVGSYLYGRMAQGILLFCVFGVSSAVLIWVISRLWDLGQAAARPEPSITEPRSGR
jgi:hypothetical protein